MVVMEVEMVSGLVLKLVLEIPQSQMTRPRSICTFFQIPPGWEAKFSEIENLVNDVNYEIQRVER